MYLAFLIIVIVIYECEFGSWMCLCVFGNGSVYLAFGGQYLVFRDEIFVIGFCIWYWESVYILCVNFLFGGACFVFCGCVFCIWESVFGKVYLIIVYVYFLFGVNTLNWVCANFVFGKVHLVFLSEYCILGVCILYLGLWISMSEWVFAFLKCVFWIWGRFFCIRCFVFWSVSLVYWGVYLVFWSVYFEFGAVFVVLQVVYFGVCPWYFGVCI